MKKPTKSETKARDVAEVKAAWVRWLGEIDKVVTSAAFRAMFLRKSKPQTGAGVV